MPGIKAEGKMLADFRVEVAQLLGRDSLNFPGAQPVSFAAKHMLELQKRDYYVCEKSDGIRCLMYMTRDGPREVTYLIDRKNDYYYVENLHFPTNLERPEDFHTDTLVDGELVLDQMPNGSLELHYLVFDCLVLDNYKLMHRHLDKRLAYFREKVYNPYQALYARYPQELGFLPFTIKFKDFELGYGIEKVFKEVLPSLPHGNDGLIFTCRTTPYHHGTDEHILKWKPAHENSIDFRLFFEWPLIGADNEDLKNGDMEPYHDFFSKPTFHLFIHHGTGQDEPYATMTVDDAQWEEMKASNEALDERIVECYLDKEGKWRFMRFRDDKYEANHISVLNSVIETIQDAVTDKDLMRCAGKIREEWKKRAAHEEAEARRAMNGHAPNGGHREASVKRKLEDGDGEAESAKRHHSAHHPEGPQH